MAKPDDQKNRHEFTHLADFDQAMRRLSQVDPKAVRKEEERNRTPRRKSSEKR